MLKPLILLSIIMTKTNRNMVKVALFLSNNHPEMYCILPSVFKITLLESLKIDSRIMVLL